MLNINRLKTLSAALLASVLVVGCDDGDDIDELVDDLFKDKSYVGEIVWPTQVNAQCPAWGRNQTVVIDKSMKLPENCVFEQVTLRFSGSDIDFDCNNAVFNGMTKVNRNEYRDAYNEEEAPRGIAFIVNDSENAAIRSSNIKIRNCQVVNYIHGIDIKLSLNADTKSALRDITTSRDALEDTLRAKAPANIQVLNSKILNMHGSGIYIYRYVTGFALIDSSVKGAGGPGLYLDAGSRSAKITGSFFEGNGYFSYNSVARSREARRSELAMREAIAVDASTRHVISNNTFRDNADGGVYLYKNCWEDAVSDPNELPRTEGANFNVIENNHFMNEATGVWIAERADRDLSGFDCGDPLVYEDDGEKYYRDYARENSVIGNKLTDTKWGIRVMDDANIIRNNTFTGTEKFDIDVGSGIRRKIADPVSGTLLGGNVLSKTDGLRYRDGAD